jgi:hypothetical protein
MKNFEELSPNTKAIIGECLRAAAYGPFFVDSTNPADPFWEVHSLFGLTIEELREVSDTWPNSINPNTNLAVQNSLGNLVGYPHGMNGEIWSKWLSSTRADIEALLKTLT